MSKLPGTRLLTSEENEEQANRMIENLEKQQKALEGMEKIIRNQRNSRELVKLKERIQQNNLPQQIKGTLTKTNKNSLLQQIDMKLKKKSEVLPTVNIPSNVNISNVALEGFGTNQPEESTNGSLLGNKKVKKAGMFGRLAKAVGAFGKGTQRNNKKRNGVNKNTAKKSGNTTRLLNANKQRKGSGTVGTGIHAAAAEQEQQRQQQSIGEAVRRLSEGETLAQARITEPGQGWTNNQIISQRKQTAQQKNSLLGSTNQKGYNESSLFTPSTIVTSMNNPLLQRKKLQQKAAAARTQANILSAKAKNSNLTGQNKLRAEAAARAAKAEANAAKQAVINAKPKPSQSVQPKPPTAPIPPYLQRQMEERRRALLARTGTRRPSAFAKTNNKKQVTLPGEVNEKQPVTATVSTSIEANPPIAPQRRGLALGQRVIGRNQKPKGTSQTTLLQAQQENKTANITTAPLTIQAPLTYEQKLETLQQRLSLNDEEEFMKLLDSTEEGQKEKFVNSLLALPDEELHTTLNPPPVITTNTTTSSNLSAPLSSVQRTLMQQRQEQANIQQEQTATNTNMNSSNDNSNASSVNTENSNIITNEEKAEESTEAVTEELPGTISTPVQEPTIISNVPTAKTETFGAIGGPSGEPSTNILVSETQRRPSGPGGPVVSTTAITSQPQTSLPFAQAQQGQPNVKPAEATQLQTQPPITPPATIQKIGNFDFSTNPEEVLVQYLLYGNKQEVNSLKTAFEQQGLFNKYISSALTQILKKVGNMINGRFDDTDIVLENNLVNIEASIKKITDALRNVESTFDALGITDRTTLLQKDESYSKLTKEVEGKYPILEEQLNYAKKIRDSIVKQSFSESDITYSDNAKLKLDAFTTIEKLKKKLSFFDQADMSIFGNYFNMALTAKKQLQAELNRYNTQQTQFAKDNLQKALGQYTIERNQAFEQNNITNLNNLVQQLDNIASLTYWSDTKKKTTILDRTIERYLLEIDALDKQTVTSRNETALKYMVYLYNCLREAVWKKANDGVNWENVTARQINTYRVKVENLLNKKKVGSVYLYPVGTPLTPEQEDSLSMTKTNDERYNVILQASNREVLEFLLQEFTVYLYNIQKTMGTYTNVAKRAASSLEKARKSALQKIGFVPTVPAPVQTLSGPKRTVVQYQQKQNSKALLEETKRIFEELKGLIQEEVKQLAELSAQKSVEEPIEQSEAITTAATGEGVTEMKEEVTTNSLPIEASVASKEVIDVIEEKPINNAESKKVEIMKKRTELLKDENTNFLILLFNTFEEDKYPRLSEFLNTYLLDEDKQKDIDDTPENKKILLSILKKYIENPVDGDELEEEIENFIKEEEKAENIHVNIERSEINKSITSTSTKASTVSEDVPNQISLLQQYKSPRTSKKSTVITKSSQPQGNIGPGSKKESSTNQVITTNPALTQTSKAEELKRKLKAAKEVAKEKVERKKAAKPIQQQQEQSGDEGVEVVNLRSEFTQPTSANSSKPLGLQALQQYQRQNPRRQSKMAQLFSTSKGAINVNTGESIKGGKRRNNKTSKRRQAKRNHSWRKSK